MLGPILLLTVVAYDYEATTVKTTEMEFKLLSNCLISLGGRVMRTSLPN
jgi:hypothetical protein